MRASLPAGLRAVLLWTLASVGGVLGLVAPPPVCAAPHLYVTGDNPSGRYVFRVFDSESGTAIGDALDLGPDAGTRFLAVNQSGTRAYVSTPWPGSEFVQVLDISTAAAVGTFVASTGLSGDPPPRLHGLALSPSGKRLYAADYYTSTGYTPDGRMQIFDTVLGQSLGFVRLTGPAGRVSPTYVVVDPFGRQAYLPTGDGLKIVDLQQGNVVGAIDLPGVQPPALSPSGRWLYFGGMSDGSNYLAVVDTRENTVVDTIPLPRFPTAVAVHPSGHQIYTRGYESGFTVIDAVTHQVMSDSVDLSSSLLSGPVVDAEAGTVFVGCGSGVCRFDAENGAPRGPIPIGLHPRNLAIGPDGDCGNGAVEVGEECDDRGRCVGGPSAGSPCRSNLQCAGDGVCRPVGGDGCASNCTLESEVHLTLTPGVVQAQALRAGTSGFMLHGDRQDVALPLAGELTLYVGKERGGEIPIVGNAEVGFPAVSVGGVCGCVRVAASKTCGGMAFQLDGTTSTDCTVDESVCPSQSPCTPVHGTQAFLSGAIRCDGVEGVNLNVRQDAGGFSRPAGALQSTIDDFGGSGMGVLTGALRVAVIDGPCTGTAPEYGSDGVFCTDDDPLSARGILQTLRFTTGNATGTVFNINGFDGIGLGPVTLTGNPFSCSALAAGLPPGAALVTTAPVLDHPLFGDVLLTGALVGVPAPTSTATPTYTPTVTYTPPPTRTITRSATPTRTATPILVPTATSSRTATRSHTATVATATATSTTPTQTIPPNLRFVDNGDGTITDTQTHLMWEKKVAGAGCLHCVEDFYQWEPGRATVGTFSVFDWLSKLNGYFDGSGPAQPGLAGHSDWRLPSRDELWSLVDCSFGETCIDPNVGPTFTDAPYWTFTTLGDQPTRAWKISFHLGLIYDDRKIFNGQVRAVRGGPPVQPPAHAPARFLDNSDGTVTDTETGLVWEKKVAGTGCTHCAEDRYAWEPGMATSGNPSIFDWLSQLNGYFTGNGPAQPGFAGYSDWRLPSRDELWSLVDCGNGSPCVDPGLGPTGTTVPYWTATTLGQTPTNAWLIGFGAAQVTDGAKYNTAYVRAVRGGIVAGTPSSTPIKPTGTSTRTPTVSPTVTVSPSASASRTATATTTQSPVATRTPTVSPTVTVSPSASASRTATATATPSPMATQTREPSCVGDCSGIGAVTIKDLIIGVNIALGSMPANICPAFQNALGTVEIAQLIKGVNNALNGCDLG